tara:strand:- start:1834 stop:2502 length:669 start_codon:yes stop_codon:yes gene_type:complete
MHQRINKKIFVYLFIFISLVTLTNTKLSYDFYKVKEFDIRGLDYEEKEKINNDLKNFKDINIFTFKKKDFSEIIFSNKIIEDFNIIKIYPSTLKIEIKKSKFLAFTKKQGIDYVVLGNGNLLEINERSLNLPFIFGDIDVKNFLEFKKLIEISNLDFTEVENLFYFKSNRWDILTQDGLTLKMPADVTIEKLNFIYKIINQDKFKDVKTIDFRQNNLMIIND